MMHHRCTDHPRRRPAAPGLVALVLAVLLPLLGGLGGGAAAGADGTLSPAAQAHASSEATTDATSAASATDGASARTAARRDLRTSTLLVRWRGNRGERQDSVTVPGIGVLTAVCRPNNTILRLRPYHRSPETQMWLAKHQDKRGKDTVAVKTVRIYRYATADDDGTGGTGKQSHEGLNRATPVEGRSSGFAHGVISQRRGRQAAVGRSNTLPVSSLYLEWYWEGFRRKDVKRQYCRVKATVTTRTDEALGLSWHGEDDGAPRRQVVDLGAAGSVRFTCRESVDGSDPVQEVTFYPSEETAAAISEALADEDPDTDGPWVGTYVERIEAEGDVRDHVVVEEAEYDPVAGLVPPVQLPENGMLRIWYYADGAVRTLIVSSYWIVNDTDPALNLCEVAAARF
ncbi:hypothetical protein [Nocardioides bruguierae]|uniref:Uncharacterized protein n=1 Tax=Nocardioides bruguierae TaxID=2945102 RepID=A0A9X2D7W4_9ACTN|nr:hypothetical protein [Nocardioides bruguierae]MCM0620791.1 hypothetical protein [Nocardioides bruguierae]